MRSKILTLAVVLGSLTGFRLIGIAAGPPATIITWNGTPQSTKANTNFAVALVAVVRDANSNGISDPGEVKPLAAYKIVALRYAHQRLGDNIWVCLEGVTFANGEMRPSYDWLLHEPMVRPVKQ